MGQIVVLLRNILGSHSWVHIGYVAPPHCLSWITLVINIFGLDFLQELGRLLWFILINLINLVASPSLVFFFFSPFYFDNGPLWMAHHYFFWNFEDVLIIWHPCWNFLRNFFSFWKETQIYTMLEYKSFTITQFYTALNEFFTILHLPIQS